MFIPIVPHTTVVNKTIVYSDTVLPLKELGSNLTVTCVKDVSEAEFENCLRIIFKSNQDVTFNTIQYSKNAKKVYFYTDKKISLEEYNESKFTRHKPLTSSKEILEEVKELVSSEKNLDEDIVSIFDVALLMQQARAKYDSIKDTYGTYNSYINSVLKDRFSRSALLILYDFDYKNKQLKVGFKYIGDDFDEITFEKKDDDLYIAKSENVLWDKDILALVGSELSKAYDMFMELADFKCESNHKVKPINSNFLVGISSYGVNIYTISSTNQFMHDFELYLPSYSTSYKYDCNSTSVISTIKGQENKLFQSIYVNIDDCPEWSQEKLREIRKSQVEKEKKKQKKLEFKRKIFPFLNK